MVNSAPLDTQDDDETTADDPDPAYVIDVSTFERSGKSFPYALSSRICESCSTCEDKAAAEGSKPPRTPSELMKHIAQNCSQQPDYLLSSTPITEAVFRLLVANSNRPMKLSKIQSELTSAWASVIYLKNLSDTVVKRMLDQPNEYYITRSTK